MGRYRWEDLLGSTNYLATEMPGVQLSDLVLGYVAVQIF